MLPIIGLVPLVDEERDSLWMLPGYMDGVRAAGGLPLMLPLTDDSDALAQLCGLCDGFLLTGGHDVSPEVYRAERLPACGACSPERDRMEAGLLARVMAADKPVLGICRGYSSSMPPWAARCGRICPPSGPQRWSTTRPRPTMCLPIRWISCPARRWRRCWGRSRSW